MTENAANILDESLMDDTFQTPEQAVSHVLNEIPSYETVNMADELWMLNQVRKQFKCGLTIKMFKKEGGTN